MYDPMQDGFRLASSYDGRHKHRTFSCFTAEVLREWPQDEVRALADLPDGFEGYAASEEGLLEVVQQRYNDDYNLTQYRRTAQPVRPIETYFSRTRNDAVWPYGCDEHLWRASRSPAWRLTREWRFSTPAAQRALAQEHPWLPHLARRAPEVTSQRRLLQVRRVLANTMLGQSVRSMPKFALKAAMHFEVALAYLMVDLEMNGDRFVRFSPITEDEQMERLHRLLRTRRAA